MILRGSEDVLRFSPSAMDGAMSLRTFGPTAVVMIAASLISLYSSCSCTALLMAETGPMISVRRPPSASSTIYSFFSLKRLTIVSFTSAKTTS